MPDLHLTLPLSDMTQALRDAFDTDDIAREMLDLVDVPDAKDLAASVAPEINLGFLADALADANGFHAEIASKLDMAEIARHASFTAALESETLETLKRQVAQLEAARAQNEALIGKLIALLSEAE